MNRISKLQKLSTQKPLEIKLEDLPQSLITNSYSETTKNIAITVWPEFIDNKSGVVGDLFIWAYHVRIDNKGEEAVKLVNRYWRIMDEKGTVQEVTGEGVVGEQPDIAPHASHQYSSGVHLRCPSGIMTGHYQMKLASGETFNAKVPSFSLDAPTVKNVIH
jgi:ApaG protein